MGLLDIVHVPKSKLEMFIRTVEVSSFMPGRIRLRSAKLVGNEELKAKVISKLRGFSELSEVEVNTLTGSLLIKYMPQLLHTNAELTRIERYIQERAKK